jgi:hypothetical protein
MSHNNENQADLNNVHRRDFVAMSVAGGLAARRSNRRKRPSPSR